MNSINLQNTKSTYKNQQHFYYANSELSEKIIKKHNLTITINNKMKYLTKEMKGFYNENYKT